MRNRRHVLDVLNTETQGIQGANCRLTARTWPTNTHVQVFHAELEGHLTGLVRRNLGRERGRFTRTTETAAAGRCPGEGITLAIGNRDDRVVEGSMDVRNRVDNVLFNLLFLRDLPLNGALRSLSGPGVCTGTLAAQRQTTTMANSTVRTEIHQTLDIHRRLTTQITFYCEGSNRGSQLRNFRFRQIFDRRIRSDACRFANLLRARVSNSVDRRQCNRDVFGQRDIYACYTCHLTNPHHLRRH
jgi:hypothetical protein